MKQLSLIITIIAIAGCSKMGALKLNTTEVKMHSLDEHYITSDGTNVTFSSRDPFIATVNETTGQVTALHVGETYIDVFADEGKNKLKVTVSPLYNAITDPITSWGMSVKELKSKLGEPLAEENTAEESTYISYAYGNANKGDKHIGTGYYFEKDRLDKVTIIINSDYRLEVVQHLAERWQYYGQEGGMYIFGDTMDIKEMKTYVSLCKMSGLWCILYSQYDK